MWLSERKSAKSEDDAVGSVTVSGEKYAVMGFSEHRNIGIYTPGGYFWRPFVGDEVLVLKDGIVGKRSDETDLLPGEVCIRSAGGAEIHLCNDGSIRLKGNLITEGEG